MIKNIFVCDKCGETIGEKPYLAMVREEQVRYDLCHRCASLVINWTESGSTLPYATMLHEPFNPDHLEVGQKVFAMNNCITARVNQVGAAE